MPEIPTHKRRMAVIVEGGCVTGIVADCPI